MGSCVHADSRLLTFGCVWVTSSVCGMRLCTAHSSRSGCASAASEAIDVQLSSAVVHDVSQSTVNASAFSHPERAFSHESMLPFSHENAPFSHENAPFSHENRSSHMRKKSRADASNRVYQSDLLTQSAPGLSGEPLGSHVRTGRFSRENGAFLHESAGSPRSSPRPRPAE